MSRDKDKQEYIEYTGIQESSIEEDRRDKK